MVVTWGSPCGRPRFASGLCGLLTLLLVLLASATGAFAHAQLLASDPADGTVLMAPPEQIVLTFSEPVVPLVFRLSDPSGRVENLPVAGAIVGLEPSATRLVVKLPSGQGLGTHSLTWRVTSADGHPIGGGLLFSVGKATSGDAVRTSAIDPVTAAGLWASRFLAMTGLVIGVGGAGWAALFSGYSRRHDDTGSAVAAKAARRTDVDLLSVVIALSLGIAATPVWIVFQGLDALDVASGGWVSADVWSAGLSATAYGRAALIGAAAMVASLVSLRIGGYRIRLALAAFALVLVGLAASAAGHAATAPQRFATVPAIMLHMMGVTAWIGGLLPLRATLGKSELAPRSEIAALLLFSRLIPFILTVLVGSGLLLAVVQVQTPTNLWTTSYGQVLLAKLAVVALMVVLAAVNRFLWTGAAAKGSPDAMRRLRRSIVAEVVLGTLVLAILGLWRFTPPPRALPSSLEVTLPVVQGREVEELGLMATLSMAPARTGPVRVSAKGLMLDGQPIDPLSVTVELDNPERGIGPFTRPARRGGKGAFEADDVVLPVGGVWRVRVTVLVDDFTSVTLTGQFDVTAP